MERSGEWLGGRFRVVGLLGRGPTGEVVEARHGTLDRPCAVKILHPDVTANPERVDAAFADLRAAAALGHPGIVDVFDTDRTDDGRPFFVMELLDGHSLAARVGGGRRLAPAQAVELVGEALATLAVAHRRGLVHGDLKPQNLYVTQSPGERACVKLLDFGASRLLATGDDRVAQFAAPQFWSPEQAAGGTEIDHRSDVYAMGAVLYVCLTGRSPFDADDPRRTRTRIVSRPFPDPRDVVPGLPDGLAEVVLHATAGYADRRFPSADTMLAALAPFLSAEARDRFGVAAGPARGAFADGRTVPEGDDEEVPMRDSGPRTHSPGRSVGFLLAVVSGPLALAAVIALLLVLQFRGSQTAPPSAPPTVVVQTPPVQECPVFPAPAPALQPPQVPAGPVPVVVVPEPRVARLWLPNLPEGAVASIDGTRIEGGVAVVPRGDRPVTVSISAPGYEDIGLTVVPADDVVVAVAMRAVAAPAPAPAPREAATSAPSPSAPSPRPSRQAEVVRGAHVARRDGANDEPVAPVEPPGTGTLRMMCNPWARVAIAGFGTRNTPFSVELPAGHYNLLAVAGGGEAGARPVRIPIDVTPGEMTKVTGCW